MAQELGPRLRPLLWPWICLLPTQAIPTAGSTLHGSNHPSPANLCYHQALPTPHSTNPRALPTHLVSQRQGSPQGWEIPGCHNFYLDELGAGRGQQIKRAAKLPEEALSRLPTAGALCPLQQLLQAGTGLDTAWPVEAAQRRACVTEEITEEHGRC